MPDDAADGPGGTTCVRLDGDLHGTRTTVVLYARGEADDVLVVRKARDTGIVVAAWGGSNAPGFFRRLGLTVSTETVPEDMASTAARMIGSVERRGR